MSTPEGDRSFQAKYTTDGKESEQEVMGRTAKTSAKWEGDALVIEFKATDGFLKRKITLSADSPFLIPHSLPTSCLISNRPRSRFTITRKNLFLSGYFRRNY